MDKLITIFDFIDEPKDSSRKNIDSGSIVFLDHAFDQIKIPKFFNLSGYTYFKELRYCNLEHIIRQVKKNRQNKFIVFMKMVMNGLSYYERQLEATIRVQENIDILIRRSKGDRLVAIGKEMNVTRERVRQIETEAAESVNLFTAVYLDVLSFQGRFENTLFFDFPEIFYFIGDSEIKAAMLYALKFRKDSDLIVWDSDFVAFINKKKKEEVEKIRNKIELSPFFDYFAHYSKLNNDLVFNENIIDFPINIYLNYLKKKKYLFKGNLAYIFGKCSTNAVISEIIRKYYKDGIVFDKKGIDDFTAFVGKLLNHPFGIASSLGKIDELNPELILWGNLSRIHIDNVSVDKEKTEELINAFKKIMGDVDYLLFSDVYKQMKSLLCGTPLTNKHRLYGFLKYYLHDEYFFKKMAVRQQVLKKRKISEMIHDFIDTHDMCTTKELISKLYISQAALYNCYRDCYDIIVIRDRHTLIEKLNIGKETRDKLYRLIAGMKKYVHREVLYNANKKLMEEEKIEDASTLFQIMRYYFRDEFDFNAPYIQNPICKRPVTMRQVIIDTIKAHDYIVTASEISESVRKQTAVKDFSLIYNLRMTGIKFFRIGETDLTLSERVVVDDINRYIVENRLRKHFEEHRFAFMKDLRELARGLYFYVKTSEGNRKFKMNGYSLSSFVHNMFPEYAVLHSSSLNNYREADYVITEKSDIKSYVDVIYAVLKEHVQKNNRIENRIENRIDSKEAIEILKEHELMTTIPTVLFRRGYLKKEENNLYLVK